MKHIPSAIIAMAVCVASFTALAAPSCTGNRCQYLPLITNTIAPITLLPNGDFLLPNGDFEQGEVIWQPSTPIITNPPAPVTPHSGTHVAQLVAAESGATAIATGLIVPADKPYLNYW